MTDIILNTSSVSWWRYLQLAILSHNTLCCWVISTQFSYAN